MTEDKFNQKYTLWFSLPQSQKGYDIYENNIKQIAYIESIPDYWKVFNNIPKVNDLPYDGQYILMKKNVSPLWEEKQNYYSGGIQKVIIPGEFQDKYWEEATLFFISNEFINYYEEQNISGISIQNKNNKYIYFEIWTIQNHRPTDFYEQMNKQLQNLIQELKDTDQQPKIQFKMCKDIIRQNNQKQQYQQNNEKKKNI